jgi:uncharacterized protein YcfJ
MKNTFILATGLAFLFLAVGCQGNKTNVVEGSVVGGLVGATAGGIIGHQSHSGLEGAGIGAAVGAVAGGLIGSQIEKKPKVDTSGTTPPADLQKLNTKQIIDLAHQGMGDPLIIERIKTTNSTFQLAPADITYLKEQGVSQAVIDVMQGKS